MKVSQMDIDATCLNESIYGHLSTPGRLRECDGIDQFAFIFGDICVSRHVRKKVT